MRTELSLSGEWETPEVLFDMLNDVYGLNCKLDVCADHWNYKGEFFVTEESDALSQDLILVVEDDIILVDVWCNPPHSKTEQFVKKADEQWKKHNLNIMMIVPANSITAHYFDNIFDNNHATYHRISGRIQFLREGKLSEHPSRNGYFVVIWRKRM